MCIRGMGKKARQLRIRVIRGFASFPEPPDTARPEEPRAWPPHMADAGITPRPPTPCGAAVLFRMTCGREDMQRFMPFRSGRAWRPVVFSLEAVSGLLMAAPGPGLTDRAAPGITSAAGLRDFRTAGDRGLHSRDRHHRQGSDADSCRAGQRVGQGKGPKDHRVMLPPGPARICCASSGARRDTRAGRAPGTRAGRARWHARVNPIPHDIRAVLSPGSWL